ncbi:hypothetical protein GYMLUDRAFT_636081 [Collybiopsis luxurians FD-317 M1]|nr:hypothetical protein GYMLUDRAFT_636081 [Collybiopsis luxurians FD-317 M1]
MICLTCGASQLCLIHAGDKLDRNDDDILRIESPSSENTKQYKTEPVERSSTQDSSVESAEIESIACRREVSWMSLGLDLSLPNILETYGNILHFMSPMSRAIQPSINLPRRPGQRRSATAHRCGGYRREEIIFTPDAVQNIILVFEQPSLNEICSQCGQVIGVAGGYEVNEQGDAEASSSSATELEKITDLVPSANSLLLSPALPSPRRKRGARKGKGQGSSKDETLAMLSDETLDMLSDASQTLVRELSKMSKNSGQSVASTSTSGSSLLLPRPHELASMYPYPPSNSHSSSSGASSSKKSSRWKLSFGKASAANLASGLANDDGITGSNHAISPTPLVSSVTFTEWRSSRSIASSSMSIASSASMSSSAYTWYSNSSVRSVSTTSISVSSAGWRNDAAHPAVTPRHVRIVSTELLHGQEPESHYYGGVPLKRRFRDAKELSLGTMSEHPPHSAKSQRSPGFVGQDANANNAALNYALSSRRDDVGPKNVQREQVNALAKMLSALRL